MKLYTHGNRRLCLHITLQQHYRHPPLGPEFQHIIISSGWSAPLCPSFIIASPPPHAPSLPASPLHWPAAACQACVPGS